MNKSTEILKKVWGFEKFRPLQEDIVNAVLDNKDVLALLPTGGGKSICFQVPALLREGICIVITPLIALMKDQVEHLKRKKISAVAVFSGMSRREIDITLDNCVYGNIKFLYVSPERLKTEMFQERVKKMKVALITVDEAHCISQWGYDFRPSYLEIAEIRNLVPEVNIIALTATATEEVKVDISEKLHLKGPEIFQKSFARENLSYSVFQEEDKERKLVNILDKVKGSGIVYVRSRRETKEIAQLLKQNGISANFYHAGLSNEQRYAIQDEWVQNKIRIIVATNAFGMGIDKPDVRVVAHIDLPDNLEAYYQEAGRAGRDERKAYAVVLYHQKDLEVLKRQLLLEYPEVGYLKKVYQSLANYYKIAVGSSFMASYDFVIEDFCTTFNLNPLETYYIIKKLEEEGFVQLNEGFYSPSKVLINLNNQQLYEFQIANAHLDLLIKALLRIYGGELFANFTKISEKQLAAVLVLPVEEIVRKLNLLNQMEVIAYDKQHEKPQLTFTTPRQDASKLAINLEKLKKRKENAGNKMNKIIEYVQQEHRCRTQVILDYFGEIAYDKCGVCDICLKAKKIIGTSSF